MEEKIKKFIKRYKELKEQISSISKTIESYLQELKTKVNFFDEFLGSYTLKVSAVVWNDYDEEKVNFLLDDIEKQIKGELFGYRTFKGISEHIKLIRSELKNLKKLYYQGDVEENDLEDLAYNLTSPFEDLENIFDDNEWDYGD